DPLHKAIQDEVSRFGNTGGTVSFPGGPLITPAQPAKTDYSGSTLIKGVPATYTDWESKKVWDPGDPGRQELRPLTDGHGYTIWTGVRGGGRAAGWVPAKYPDPGTGIPDKWVPPPVVTPAVPAVYGPPGPPYSGYVGVWKPEYSGTVFPLLLCPSDPS